MTIDPTVTSPEIGEPVVTKRVKSAFFQDMEDDIEYSALDPEEFAEEIPGLYHYISVNKDIPLDGIFDNEYYESDPDLPVELESATPTFLCQSSKLIHPKKREDTIIIRGIKYEVDSHKPDGTGMTLLILKK